MAAHVVPGQRWVHVQPQSVVHDPPWVGLTPPRKIKPPATERGRATHQRTRRPRFQVRALDEHEAEDDAAERAVAREKRIWARATALFGIELAEPTPPGDAGGLAEPHVVAVLPMINS